MPAAARQGDQEVGTCDLGLPDCPHSRTGTNAVVSGDVFINGLGAHRKGDTGPCNCPHGGTFATTGGSGTVFIDGCAASALAMPQRARVAARVAVTRQGAGMFL